MRATFWGMGAVAFGAFALVDAFQGYSWGAVALGFASGIWLAEWVHTEWKF